MGSQSIGFVGPAGLTAARNAMARMIADALAREDRERKYDMDLRKQEEIERAARSGEGLRGRGLDIEEGGLNERIRQFDAEAPERSARTDYLGAQTRGLNQKTQFEGEDRTNFQNMVKLLPAEVPGKVSPQTLANLKYFGDLDLTTPSGRQSLYSSEDLGKQEGAAESAAFEGGGRGVYKAKSDIDTQNALREINARGAFTGAGGGGQGAKEDMQKLADMVLGNPDLLKEMNPTLKGQVLRTIAANDGQLPNRRMQALDQVITGAEETIGRLEGPSGRGGSGFRGAVGTRFVPSRAFGLLDEPMAGTDAAGYNRFVEQLKSQLALPRLEFLRGLGHMSDREFKAITDSVSALDTTMSEATFMQELGRIKTALANVRSRVPRGGGTGQGGPGEPSPAASSPAPGTRQTDANGRTIEWDGKGWFVVR